jgi:hypothetical protein
MKRSKIIITLSLLIVFMMGCGKQTSICLLGTATPSHLEIPPEDLPIPSAGASSAPVEMEIGGRMISVDKVVEGPLCNDTWSGTVYVTCNVQVYPWGEYPDFLKNCNLDIEPGTIVYVAHHNDTAYYNGCSSCHTEEVVEP